MGTFPKRPYDARVVHSLEHQIDLNVDDFWFLEALGLCHKLGYLYPGQLERWPRKSIEGTFSGGKPVWSAPCVGRLGQLHSMSAFYTRLNLEHQSDNESDGFRRQ